MEVGYHEIGVVVLKIHRGNAEHESGKSADREHHHEADREEHRGFEGHGPLPHGGNPVEHLHARWHGDQHGCVHEEQFACQRHAYRKHVVSPHDEGEERDGSGGVHH